jgi:hypothetical protein
MEVLNELENRDASARKQQVAGNSREQLLGFSHRDRNFEEAASN